MTPPVPTRRKHRSIPLLGAVAALAHEDVAVLLTRLRTGVWFEALDIVRMAAAHNSQLDQSYVEFELSGRPVEYPVNPFPAK